MLDHFHPAVADWFNACYSAPTGCQQRAWTAIREGQHTLISAPTGSGKTLAAFLAVLDELAREAEVFGLPDETRIVYVSPLKALSNDIQKNLEAPLDGINRNLFQSGALGAAIRSLVRTGDTPAAARAAMIRQPPHILVTTPESLYILLTSQSGRRVLGTVRTVIVDEIHAVAGTKRGAHLALSLERLERLAQGPLRRIGLSATQRPIDLVGQFLTGADAECTIIDHGHRRPLDLAVELPTQPLESILSQQASGEIFDRMATLIQTHRTTLVFVNTRRLAERVARALSGRVGEQQVTSHHGSLSREQRLAAEDRLKHGRLRALVATASLELGIDVGDVDLVCQLGSTGSIATFLQRVGRSGHTTSGLPKGRIFPTTRDELVECMALIQAVRRGDLDDLAVPAGALDVLAQQVVAMAVSEDWSEDDLYRCIVRAFPYRELHRSEFDALLRMLAEGYSTHRGQRGAYLHRDGINRRIRARKGARLTAVTCGGAIPDAADYRVLLEPAGDQIGTVDEHFAIESMAGDVFQLGNSSWRVLGLEGATLRVADAAGQPPTIPFWFGEAPGRTDELSKSVSRLRRAIEEALQQNSLDDISRGLAEETGIDRLAVEQVVNYLAATKSALGVVPTMDCIVFERFFDESGGMQFVIHAPFGSRLNRAWGLALRKRFCRTFNFELQAAANENALILSLGMSQSFPLEDVKGFLRPDSVRDILVQALLDAPMFTIRWRWNAVCSLAIQRFQNGKRTPPHLLRMQAQDLVTSVFPDQLACFENLRGDREIPDHPLVQQTIQDCLTEAMDLDLLIETLARIQSGAIKVVCRDVTEPSPMAAEIVNARVYSFLDDAPLEERRTRAVRMRRGADPAVAAEFGGLDPEAVDRVRRELWPEIRSPDELHDALSSAGFLMERSEIQPEWLAMFRELIGQRRAARLVPQPERALWIAAERWPQFRLVYLGSVPEPPLSLPPEYEQQQWTFDNAVTEIVRARLAVVGPTTESALVATLGIAELPVRSALTRLEQEGFVLRGQFSRGLQPEEWCERRALARIHRYMLHRLRREIEPVSASDFMQFLLRWQHVHPEANVQGSQALAAVISQLEGFEAAAGAWESEILPARVAGYDPVWLDQLCQSGRFSWLRLSPGQGAQAPVRTTPIALVSRRSVTLWREVRNVPETETLSGEARVVLDVLQRNGAQFYDELVDRSRLLATIAERALAELVAAGCVTADSFAGLRALLVPEARKHRYKGLGWGLASAGRWTSLSQQDRPEPDETPERRLEYLARALLSRYGVMFRSLLARESAVPSWPDLLRCYRTLEARGDIRGGRFIAGQYGEQFALPDAVEALRAVRRQEDEREVAVNAADPLNLVGILFPGAKIPASSGRWIVFRRGFPSAVSDGPGKIRLLDESAAVPLAGSDQDHWQWVAPGVRAYLRRP